MASDRDHLVYLAKIADQAELYNDMVDAMKKLAKINVELSFDERNLFSSAFKHIMDARRKSWGALSVIEQQEGSKSGNEINAKRLRDYLRKIELEIADICNDVIQLIDDHLLPFASTSESSAYYYRMKGDYYRYLAEVKSGDEKKQVVDLSLNAYEAGMAEVANLPPTHPIRLGVVLNLSVFYYEIINDSERACDLARKAFDEAMPELDKISEESVSNKQSRWIMTLLRDNLASWNSENNPENDASQVAEDSSEVVACERE